MLGVVICDLIAVPGDVVRAAKERIAKRNWGAAERVMICATATHRAVHRGSLGTPPRRDTRRWPQRIADAFIQASRCFRPAQVAFTWGNCASEVHNRRVMKDGSVAHESGYQHRIWCAPAGSD